MSFSIDDLVSSLSSTHVGQEAMDLAVLQAQLAETLFNPSSSSSSFIPTSRQPPRGRAQHTQPCNTPLARTPSSSASWMMDSSSSYTSTDRARSNSVSSAYGNATANDMDEDERMVEELLMPSSNANSNSNSNSFAPPSSSYHGYNYNQAPLPSPISPHSSMGFSPSPYSPSSYTDPSQTSLFTSTDPFYLSQLQSLNSPSSPSSQSVFAQNGRLAQNSPFAMSSHGQYQHQYSHQQIPLSSYTAAF